MQDNIFYLKYANVPLEKRFKIISNDFTSQICGMTLNDVYQEVKVIDDKIRNETIRKQHLLDEVEQYL